MKTKRLWLIGDLHSGVNSNSVASWKVMLEYFNIFLIPLLKSQVKDGDLLCFSGDITDNGSSQKVELSNSLIDIFTELSKILPVEIIIGNHDIVKKYTNEINSIRPLGMIPNVNVRTESTEIPLVNDEKLFLLPWCHSADKELSEISGTKAQYMLSHAHYMGMTYDDEYVWKDSNGNVISTPLECLDKFKRVWNGHIHKSEVFGNRNHIRNLGIPHQMKWGDFGYNCGVTFFDIETQTEKFVPNNFSPIHKYFNLMSFLEMDIDDINEQINNSYIRILYPTSMRKLLDLEKILEFVEGYRSIEFVPTTEDVKDHKVLERMQEFSTDKTLDVKHVIPSYVESLPEDADIRNRLRKDLDELYEKSQNT